jgi:hypothetical protein
MKRSSLGAAALLALAIAAVLLALLVVPMCRGQTFDVAGGHDGMIGNGVTGVYVSTWLPDGWNIASGWGSNGVGFSARRLFSLGTLVLGDSIPSFNTPGIGLATPVRGAAFTMKNGVTFFAGATGDSFTEPFLQTQNKFESLGGGILYTRKLSDGLTFAGAALSAKHKDSAVASLLETQKHFSAYLSGGLVQSNPALDYGVSGQSSIFTAALSRSTLIENNLSTSFADEMVGAHFGNASVGASRFSGKTSGDSFFGFWQVRETTGIRALYLTAANERVWDAGIVQKILGSRFSISPGANHADGTWSWNVGGTFTSNPLAISVSYEEFFLPLALKNPWEKTLLVSIALQLPHSARATVRSLLNANGQTKWTTYGDKYLVGPLGDTQGAGPEFVPSFERWIVSGTVTNERGEAVLGAAVKVGKTVLFTDSNGYFEVRVKNRPYPLEASPKDFSAPGEWKILSCPASASPGESIKIVVAKL